MDILFLNSPTLQKKPKMLMRGLYRAAKHHGLNCEISNRYQPCKALVIYGLGGNDRFSVGMDHVAEGNTLLSFDLGYWGREVANRKYRFSLNGLHPTQVMDGDMPSPDRFKKSGLKIQGIDVNEGGPIMLVGNSPKSRVIGAEGWSKKKSLQIRKWFPDKEIIYRPKPKRPHEIGVSYDAISTAPIESELRRVSLVVARHSNVSVDATMLGVPVVCDDGAAACIYPKSLSGWRNQPNIDTRTDFLNRLAYWQWSASEVKLFWKWFLNRFPEHDYRMTNE